MSENGRVATTVKIKSSLYDDFKIFGIRHKITLQSLLERTMYRYVNEENFRQEINNFNLPVIENILSETPPVESPVLTPVSEVVALPTPDVSPQPSVNP